MPRGLAVLPLLMLGAWGCARETEAVACFVTYGGKERSLEFRAKQTPYDAPAVNIDGRFAFKATFVREPWQAAAINVYAYERTDSGDRLLQEGKYGPPWSLRREARHGFTGRQLVYSRDERELEYWCRLSR